MARSRLIKPSFFTNDDLAECLPLARLLFIGLWTIADREGRIICRPKKIKVEILPYDNCDIEKLLLELQSYNFITIYEVDKNKYLQINKFKKHQQPHHKEIASAIPEICKKKPIKNNKFHACPKLKSSLPQACVKVNLRKSCLAPLNPYTLTLNPLPLTLIPLKEEDEKKIINESFEEFWKLYPKTRAGCKKRAKTSYLKAINEKKATTEEIKNGVEKYRNSDEATKNNGQFAKGCAAWLNDDRWKNSYKPPRQKTYKHNNQKTSYLDKIQNAGKIAREQFKRDEIQDDSQMPWNRQNIIES